MDNSWFIRPCNRFTSTILFRRDQAAKVAEELEQFSMTVMQEIYQLKKRMSLLEEELLLPQEQSFEQQGRLSSREQLLKDVVHWHEAGYSSEEIAAETELTPMEVEHLLKSYLTENV